MLPVPKWLADAGRWLNQTYYRQLFQRTYVRKNPPSWFDHRIDLYYHWPDHLFWLERGILPRRQFKRDCVLLDLFCGDGFYSRYFHSSIARHIDAVDKDPQAIAHAQRFHAHPKITFAVLDALTDDFPHPSYDAILWFEAIEHLKPEAYAVLVKKIKAALGEHGVLIGSTPVVSEAEKGKLNWEHENEFGSQAELRAFLARDFASVEIDTTWYPTKDGGARHTMHFVCRSGGMA